jgi:hypothetical protein
VIGDRRQWGQRVIPWSAILRHAPTILAAADALLARTRASSAGGQTRSIEARLGELEDGARASAQLAQDMAQQIQALTIAHDITARRARVAIWLSVAAAVLAIVAGILAIVL